MIPVTKGHVGSPHLFIWHDVLLLIV